MNKVFWLFGLLFLVCAFGVFASPMQCDDRSNDGRFIVDFVLHDCNISGVIVDECVYEDFGGRIAMWNGSIVRLSSDYGRSFSNVAVFPFNWITVLTISNDGSIIVVYGNGIFVSVDAGHSFTKVSDMGASISCISDDNKYVFISGDRFLVSSDGGHSFNVKDSPISPPSYASASIIASSTPVIIDNRGVYPTARIFRSLMHTGGSLLDISPDGKYVMVASTGGGISGGWLWRSDDFGQSIYPMNMSSDRRFVAIRSSCDFRVVVVAEIGRYGGGDCINTVGDLFVSNDYGRTLNLVSALGTREWKEINVSCDGQTITVLSYYPSKAKYPKCPFPNEISMRSPSMDISYNSGVSWSLGNAPEPYFSGLSGLVVSNPDRNVSFYVGWLGWVFIVFVVALIIFICFISFRKKKRGRR